MNVLFCGDRNIGDGVFLSVISLLAHTGAPLRVYLMTAAWGDRCQPLEPAFARRLKTYLAERRPGSAVTLLDISGRFAAEPPTANMDTRFTPAVCSACTQISARSYPTASCIWITTCCAAAIPPAFGIRR